MLTASRRTAARSANAPASIDSEVTGLRARLNRGANRVGANRSSSKGRQGDTSQDAPQAARTMGWTSGAAHGAGLVRLLLLLALLAGPAALLLWWQAGIRVSTQVPASTAAQQDPGEVAAVGNFAEEFVTAWLTTPAGNEQALSFYLQTSNGFRLPSTVSRIQNVAVADVTHVQDYAAAPSAPAANTDQSAAGEAGAETEQQDGVAGPSTAWQVTVAADVEEPDSTGARVMVRRYFAVPVLAQVGTTNGMSTAAAGASRSASAAAPTAVTGPTAGAASSMPVRQMRALLLPTPVAGPVSGEGAELAYNQQVNITGGLGTSISQFLAAYATGSGDVTRYVTPGHVIKAITPAPYLSVQVQSVLAREDDPTSDAPSDGQHAQVLVTAVFGNRDQQPGSTQYALDLTARGGRWEISSIAPGPALTLPTAAGTAHPASSAANASPAASTAAQHP
ncbi:conjugal transfer protein [Kineococcus radiotolerans]|uniref:Conjugative transposon protein TcpC n=1 Tax=Kineococcus radiotolerans (strain ATCC BAA-149 / DSM 14245 / SRS30216) TaxID=266940 RepID=A6WH04_KINRD|nr:conjugal transfer protein [Kineococcus radiotolerans]ABS06093.1 hypothetical protein Krad_4634 [Kineococcus radiotolerans SRS30216 = ATCC BAA-149]